MFPEKPQKFDNVLSLLKPSGQSEEDLHSHYSKGGISTSNFNRTHYSSMKPDDKDKTVTFDFKGNLLHVKKPKIHQDADQIVVKPGVRISTSSRRIHRNLQQFNRRPSEGEESLMLVEQIQENLDQLYEEGEKKLLAVRSSV